MSSPSETTTMQNLAGGSNVAPAINQQDVSMTNTEQSGIGLSAEARDEHEAYVAFANNYETELTRYREWELENMDEEANQELLPDHHWPEPDGQKRNEK